VSFLSVLLTPHALIRDCRLFGRTFFTNLGLGPGSALLAGISFLLMPVFWVRAFCLTYPWTPSLTSFTASP
jgi:hypothetical protein